MAIFQGTTKIPLSIAGFALQATTKLPPKLKTGQPRTAPPAPIIAAEPQT